MEMPSASRFCKMRCTWPDAQLPRDQFIHHRRMRLLQIVEQHLHVLPRQNFVAMPAHRLRQMRDQHRRRVHHGEAARPRRSCVPLSVTHVAGN